MKYSFHLVLIILAMLAAGCHKEAPVNKFGKLEGSAFTVKTDFNRDWEFVKSPAEWAVDFMEEELEMEPVILPHTWNEADMGPGLREPFIGSGWYRKHFWAPRLKPGQRLLIEFEGVNNYHRVWVNGGYAGGRNGGFLSSLLDITDLLAEGENTILVRADNAYDLKAAMPLWIGWNRYGGITRPVWLHIRDHSYIACAGVEIRTPQVSAGSAHTVVRTHIEETRIGGAALEVRHTLISPGGKGLSTTTTPLTSRYSLTSTVEAELPILKNPELWSDLNPVLYTLRTEILEGGSVIDSREDRIGYRFFHFDSEQGFTLNGIPTKLKGANIHIFFPGLGNALPERFHREDMKLMKEMGCNFMRTSHYPRPQATLEACDELGILVMEEQPYWHGSVRASGGEEAIHNASRLISDMVRQHGNHPSIIAWNTVNEVMIAPAYKPGVGHLPPGHPGREAWRINPREYPYLRRHLAKMVKTFKEVDPQRPVAMVVGGQWEKNDIAGLTAITDIVAYNGGAMNLPEGVFTGPKTGKTYEFKPDYYREIYPDRIHMISEGVLNDFFFARGQWEKEQAGWRVNARYWSILNQRPWICGGSMWCFTDYSYEGNLDHHGAVDRYRLPKELFPFYEAMWADHPVLHILGHWNHGAGLSREVVVFTNCREVELSLNGKSLGKGISCTDEYPGIENAPLVWKDVAFEEGTLEVRGNYGPEELVDRRVTAGKAERLMLTASNDTLIADGRDISYVDFTICDADGNRCYTTNCSLSVKVYGPARLAGPDEIKVPAGLARVAIRSTGDPGEITIEARGEGLSAGQLSLRAHDLNIQTAREYHVSSSGTEGNPGSESKPFRTISAAAQVAQPGDVITVHEGVYRERINPPRGGTSDSSRILYRAAKDEKVVIKGSERIKGWEKVQEGVWKVTLSSDFFGKYNPYRVLISGDWFFPGGREHHTGEVFLNEVSLFEVDLLEQVLNPIKDQTKKGSEYTWYCESDEEKTDIYANFHQYEPNNEIVEISVRESCFYPAETGINYITVRGFHMTQAATQWAPPTAEQIGLIGTNWSKGWIIENNSVSNSRCAGITLGKDSKSGNNVGDPADEGRVPDGVELYNNVVDIVIAEGWNRERIGSHIVRNNEIFDCGQAGICGSLGAIFSEISNNHIHDIWTKEQFHGFEMGGIKIHAAIDMLIENNHIHNAHKGIWLDWMAQGTRISGNICYDNMHQDLFLEVNHGPVLVDNNLFLSPFGIRSLSTGEAYVHNLVMGKTSFGSETRTTPLFKPHTTQKIGTREIPGGDDRFYNNIFAGEGLDNFMEATLPLYVDGNVYLNGAKPYIKEQEYLEQMEFDPKVHLECEGEKLFLHIIYNEEIYDLKNKCITSELLGRTVITKQLFETSKGTPIKIDEDFFGKKRNTKNPVAGPFEINESGVVKLQIR